MPQANLIFCALFDQAKREKKKESQSNTCEKSNELLLIFTCIKKTIKYIALAMPEEITYKESNLIENRIFHIRGVPVMLDTDLAELYHVETKVLNQAVKRNIERFPNWTMFRINIEELHSSRSQIVTLKKPKEDKT